MTKTILGGTFFVIVWPSDSLLQFTSDQSANIKTNDFLTQ